MTTTTNDFNQSNLLSDVLVNTGSMSNPRNNCSQAGALSTMLLLCENRVKSGEDKLRTKYAFNLAVDILNRKGFNYYKKDQYKV